jgi:hypothetical protein
VHVHDPFAPSLARAGERFAEAARDGTPVELTLSDQWTALPDRLDAVIVATNADCRADVVRRLLKQSQVRFLILEKVLFQRDADYVEIADRLTAARTSAWVNCPRRMFAAYQSLRQQLSGRGPQSYRAVGGGWGLACNGVHLLDHAAFLCGRDDLQGVVTDLHPGAVASKRSGYVELLGTLRGAFGDGSTIELSCPTEASHPVTIEVVTSQLRVVIREDQREIRLSSLSGLEPAQIVPLEIRFQSELSHLVVQSLLDHGTCPLTPYAESARLHRPFVAALLQHYRQHVDPGADACPIT